MHETIQRLSDIWKTCNKIRAAVFRVGLNLWDWYLPIDPDKNHLISESKFVSILAGPLRPVVGLSDQEISQLADYFKTQDGRILYFQMCEVIHGEDVKHPDQTDTDACLLDACPPPPEPPCRTLNRWQKHRLCLLLATIASRQLVLRPYFQDYELVTKNDGRITFTHFARILSFLSIQVSPEDFNLLVRRFIQDAYTIDYVAFLQAVDDVQKYGIKGLGPEGDNPYLIIDTTQPKTARPEIGVIRPAEIFGETEVFHPILEPPRPDMGLVEIMLRIQKFIRAHRIRVSEFFRDCDPLNSGRLMPCHFRRAMDLMGLSGLGHDMYLTSSEVECVIQHYTDPNDKERICWRTFEDDLDQAFTVKELEKFPDLKVVAPSPELKHLPALGAKVWDEVPLDTQDYCESAILRIKEKLIQRPLDLKDFFKDHDKHNNGHISRSNVRQAMARATILLSPQQMLALEDRFGDDLGFFYVGLLNTLESMNPPKKGVPETIKEQMVRLNTRVKGPESYETDIVQILAKIKGKVVREGIRLLDFLKPYDPNSELVISRENFYRAVCAATLRLTPFEMETIMQVFASPLRRRHVEYRRFSDTVEEAVCQTCVDRAPLLVPVQHLPPRDTRRNFLTFEERNLVSMALQKLSMMPDLYVNIMEVFQDFDRERCGSITKMHFQRALTLRGLSPLLSGRELEVLCKCFGYERGCSDEVDYRAFNNTLNVLYATCKSQPC